MKRFLLSLTFFVLCMSAVEITVLGGGNYQTIKYYEEGYAYHGGVIIDQGIKLFEYLSLQAETGAMYHRIAFQETFTYDDTFSYYRNRWINTLVIPLVVSARLHINPNFYVGLGSGFACNDFFSGGWKTNYPIDDQPLTKVRYDKEELLSFWDWRIKGEVGIKLLPHLWLKPSFTASSELDLHDSWSWQRFYAYFFSVGLALKL